MELEKKEEFILIPFASLPEPTMEALLEEFILREGTDYGAIESTLDEKRARLYKQVMSGDVVILFSTLTENTTLITKSDFKKIKNSDIN